MTLYIVATPIGNLEDLTLRARGVLLSTPVVFAEDTRQTRKLLTHINAHPKLFSYHHHTRGRALEQLLDVLSEHDVALVTDAGTPGVSDPGGELVLAATRRFGEQLKIVPIPGPSALIGAASIAGFSMDRFHFLGFPPHKKGRQTYFDEVATLEDSVIFFESPHRIIKTLAELTAREPHRLVMIGRELTKLHETIYRGTLEEVNKVISQEPSRGEYVVVLAPQKMSHSPIP